MSAPTRAVDESSSSDSENEEEMERLREASSVEVPGSTINLATKCSEINKICRKYKSKKLVGNRPSLRCSQNGQDDNFNSDLHLTAEVKAFIAKKLSQSLDMSIEVSGEHKPVDEWKKKCQCEEISNDELGFRMFSKKTQKELKAKREAKKLTTQRARKTQKQQNSDSDSSEEEVRLAEAAVSPEFILRNNSMVSMETEQRLRSEANNANSDICGALGSNRSQDSSESDLKQNKTEKKKFKRKKCEKRDLAEDCSAVEIGTNETFTEMASCVGKKKKKKKCKHSHSDS